jgi:D-glycero-D-manno-heptose 1,7-bisphosphate phosphatase
MKYIIFDRDGTLIVEKQYLSDPEGVELLPGVREGLNILKELGYRFVVITNQSGLARGYYSIAHCHRVNERLSQILKQSDIIIDKYYICPHHPEFSGKCSCRKPETGLLDEAVNDFFINTQTSFFVGDKCSDMLCGQKKNIKSVMIMTGYGKHEQHKCNPELKFNTILEFAEYIRSREK